MAETQNYDLVVIGAGQSGDPLARAFAAAGKTVALVERDQVGGTCVNVGCTPTKTMVASARVAYLARRAADYGVGAGPVSVDLSVVRERKRAIVKDFRGGSEHKLAAQQGLDLIYGEARFTGPKEIAVALREGGERLLTGGVVVLNVGARPAPPDLPGLREIPFLDSTSIMELNSVPEHLLVLGGGYIALEFAQMFRRFGSQVTIAQRSGHLLGREDKDVTDEVLKIVREDGIEVLLNAAAQHVEGGADGVRLTVTVDGAERILSGSHLLVATGRRPNTDRLGAEAAGVALDPQGNIIVNDRLETSVSGVYAMGDAKGGPAFTHISYDDFRILKANLLDGGSRSVQDRPTPYTMFIDPQLGRVGLSETEAKAQGRSYRVAKLPMSSVARALETDESRGFMKALVDTDSGQILGAAILGLDGGEVMGALQIAMMGKLPYTALRDGVFAHPTLLESLNNLFLTLD
ncbi:mercuric reductase [Capsulimonas corticalis]|uniref:Mercuric reductase n=1 Tax=Capsulimonas corticalis TaxID=2219043 RepID=A0A402D4C1_9BACT|nr:mercuric reductase [Capsulimonas corticalis]BDI29160.1 mercuric reductase [Capsulimonas corticalis]